MSGAVRYQRGRLCHRVTTYRFFFVNSPLPWYLFPSIIMAPIASCIQSHKRDIANSAKLSQDAHDNAFKSRGYNFIETQKRLVEEFQARNNNMEPYEWQLDVSEALMLGLDCSVIVGTGGGKTMPLYIEKDKIIVVISPLNALEEDQVQQFIFHTKLLLTRR